MLRFLNTVPLILIKYLNDSFPKEQNINRAIITSEVTFETSRSGGPGGQNVNKVETKVRLHFIPSNSKALYPDQVLTIINNNEVKKFLDIEGCITITSQKYRTQIGNKSDAIEKLITLLKTALKPVATRKATKIPKSQIRKRLQNKKHTSEKKSLRRIDIKNSD